MMVKLRYLVLNKIPFKNLRDSNYYFPKKYDLHFGKRFLFVVFMKKKNVEKLKKTNCAVTAIFLFYKKVRRFGTSGPSSIQFL